MSEDLLVSRILDLKVQEAQLRTARQRLEDDLRAILAKKMLEEREKE